MLDAGGVSLESIGVMGTEADLVAVCAVTKRPFKMRSFESGTERLPRRPP